MKVFNYSFLENGLLPSSLINIISSVYSLKTMEDTKYGDFTKIFSELEPIAKIQSVRSSNAIEGIVTSDERILDIINNKCEPLNHNEEEIAGYRDALNIIHLNYNEIDFNEKNILNLHKIMMSYSDYGFGGEYKKNDNVILEIEKDGKQKVRFRPISTSETKEAMEQLILAYMNARSNSNINQLLLIPCVILDFLCIHPFQDGNGRISRLLSLLLLYKSGFDIGKYISFEEQINNRKDLYYQSLNESSIKWEINENSYYPFIENFITIIYMCYKELDKRFAVINGKKITKNNRIEATILNSLTPLSKSEICKILPDISPTTVEATLGKMLKEKKIMKIGSARTTRYLRN